MTWRKPPKGPAWRRTNFNEQGLLVDDGKPYFFACTDRSTCMGTAVKRQDAAASTGTLATYRGIVPSVFVRQQSLGFSPFLAKFWQRTRIFGRPYRT